MGSGGHRDRARISIENVDKAREFLTIAVHDLREPLRAIRSSSELLARALRESTDEDTVRYLRFISEGTDRMEALIRDIAEFCYGELQTLNLAEADSQEALAEAQRQLSDELKKNEAILTHDPLPAVSGDSLGLTTVFRCLIENSCKFRGPVAPDIHVGADKRGSEWVFSVRDNGQGFNPAYRDRVFEPFERLNGRRYPGSGLGLPLARRIVERHGGRMWVESHPGQGSTFWFTLPAPE
ncbi:MAG TPA: ATP-binding protein [Bryobacteraceae bacterium]|nr:ATP-binding protein [Bryobacteraceae bacterium]